MCWTFNNRRQGFEEHFLHLRHENFSKSIHRDPAIEQRIRNGNNIPKNSGDNSEDTLMVRYNFNAIYTRGLLELC